MSHVSRIDADGRPLAPAVQALYDEEQRRAGRVTNMKAVLLHSLPAFRTFSSWHVIKDEVRAAIGERALSIYSHAISATAGCLLCSTYFRRLLLNEGIEPEDFTPTAEEALLIELGHAIGKPQEPPKPDLMDRLKQRYTEPTLVNLVAYGGTMLATNVFNNMLGMDLDEYLEPFLASEAETTRRGQKVA
jgi:hypothetical protein